MIIGGHSLLGIDARDVVLRDESANIAADTTLAGARNVLHIEICLDTLADAGCALDWHGTEGGSSDTT